MLCEITASSISSDSFHLTKPSSEGAFRSMHNTLIKALKSSNPPTSKKRKKTQRLLKIKVYVNAHATSTKVGDESEATAIAAVLGKLGVFEEVLRKV